MDEDLHNIEDLFKSALDDNEEMPSPKTWKGIDNALDKDNMIRIEKKYNNLKKVVFLLLFILTGICVYELNNGHNNNKLAKTNSVVSRKQPVRENNIDDVAPANKNLSPDAVVQPLNNFIRSRQNQKVISNSKNLKNTNTPYSLKQDDNNAIQINYPFSVFRELKFLSVEPANTPATLFDIKKIIPPFASTTNPSFIDIKNPVALNNRKKWKPSRFSATIFFSPDLASYRLQNDRPDNQPDNATQIEKSESHEFSSTSGVLIHYRLNKHWILQSGLSFSNISITVDPRTIYARSDNSGNIKYRLNISSGYAYIFPSFQNAPNIGDSLYVSSLTHKLRYVGIPVALEYRVLKSKISLKAMAGVAVNLLIKGQLETEVKNSTHNEVDILNNIQGLKSIYLNGLTGIGAEYNLSKHLAFTLMPTARFALSSINKGAVVKSYPNSFGLTTGMRIKLQ